MVCWAAASLPGKVPPTPPPSLLPCVPQTTELGVGGPHSQLRDLFQWQETDNEKQNEKKGKNPS